MKAWEAARVAEALLEAEHEIAVNVVWSDDGTEWSVNVEHARGAGPHAIARALRAIAAALEETAN